MSRFNADTLVSHSDDDAVEFVSNLAASDGKVLFIGTVGLESPSRFFPVAINASKAIDFRLFIEERPTVHRVLTAIGDQNRKFLEETLGLGRATFHPIKVVADDGATIAGRQATAAAREWLDDSYTDIVIDATGMSRGTCVPVVKQVVQFAGSRKINTHLLVASHRRRTLHVRAEINNRADWMHGFQGIMGSDRADDYMKLWVPQLSEHMAPALSIMDAVLPDAAEVCPIVPFPAFDLRRGDRLLWEHHAALQDKWETGALDLIYDHENDPTDVFRTISRLHRTRNAVFGGSKWNTTTILSPSGWRIGSIGMLLAALEHDLPMLYVETVGYNCDHQSPPADMAGPPDVRWHLWLTGTPYLT